MTLLSNVHTCAALEFTVFLLQFLGVVSLFASRLAPGPRWADWGRMCLVLTLLGLGVVGCLLSAHNSEFSLFAGGTITVLLIGTTVGGHSTSTPMPDPSPIEVF
jgi:hypothetical protein